MPIGPARMPLMDHLGELRRRLAIVAVSLLVTSVVVYVATPTLIDIMLDPIRDVFESNELTVLSVLGGFTIRFKVAFFFSLIINYIHNCINTFVLLIHSSIRIKRINYSIIN